MQTIQEQKRYHYEINSILKRKNGEGAACLKNSVRNFVEKIYKGFWRVAVCLSYI
jgi:hypothetical protein